MITATLWFSGDCTSEMTYHFKNLRTWRYWNRKSIHWSLALLNSRVWSTQIPGTDRFYGYRIRAFADTHTKYDRRMEKALRRSVWYWRFSLQKRKEYDAFVASNRYALGEDVMNVIKSFL